MNTSSSHIIYATGNTSLMQDDHNGQFVLRLFGQSYVLDRYAHSAFRKRIKEIDLATLICNDRADIEIIELPQTANFLVLDIRQLIELKELLAGTSAMLELNACIHKQIRRKTLHC